MKALVTDELAKVLLGPKGASKDQIQAETGTKFVFSNKGEYYPSSHHRVLGIYAEETGSILKAFSHIVPRVIELGDAERRNGHVDGGEFIGKEPGEYMLRIAISKPMSGEIIGVHGSRIKELRRETGCKVFIDNNTIGGHQMTRIIGAPQALTFCLERIAEATQRECGTDEHIHWAQLVNFSEMDSFFPPEGGRNPVAPAWQDRERGQNGPVVAHSTKRRRGHGKDENGFEHSGVEGVDLFQADNNKGVSMIADAVDQLPPGSAEADGYGISFTLPTERVDLLQSDSELLGYVERHTGAKVEFFDAVDLADDQATRQVQLTGPLLMVYTAHLLLLKRVSDEETREQEEKAAAEAAEAEAERAAAEQAAVEQEEQERAAQEDPKALMAQIAELQAKVREAEARKTARLRL